MNKKIVVLDEDLVEFLVNKCDADEKLAKLAIARTNNVNVGRKMADYVVKTRRVRAALESAKDNA